VISEKSNEDDDENGDDDQCSASSDVEIVEKDAVAIK
jgi:hypothetical protein